MTIHLLAHGSADPRHAQDVERIATRLARRLGAPPCDVRPCYLDHCGPTLAQVADAPGTVVPLLLSPGYHATVDVEHAVSAATVPLTVAEPPVLTSGATWGFALLAEVRAAWPGHQVVLVGAGTRDTRVLRGWEQTSRALRVPVVQASGPGPRLDSPVPDVPTVAVPLLVARGTFSDRIAADAVGLGLAVAEPAGCSEALIDELVRVVRERVPGSDGPARRTGGWPHGDGRTHNPGMTDFDTIERRLSMAAPPALIAEQLVDFRRWVDWSPWEGLDPDLRRTYSGPDTGVGAAYEWAGNRKAGAGRMAITSVTADEVAVDLRFTRPFKSTSAVTFTLVPADSQTEVVWTMRSPRTLATRVFGLVMNMDKAIGSDLEKGLATLKSLVEEA